MVRGVHFALKSSERQLLSYVTPGPECDVRLQTTMGLYERELKIAPRDLLMNLEMYESAGRKALSGSTRLTGE